MNKIERTALAYLLKTGKTKLIYRSHDSPDFYNTEIELVHARESVDNEQADYIENKSHEEAKPE